MIEEIDVGRVRHVLDKLVEELVLRCELDAPARVVTLITPSSVHAIGDGGAFIRFRFAGARDVATYRHDGIVPGIQLQHPLHVIAGTFVPDGVRGRALGIGFYGGRGGGIRLGYESVRAEVRHVRYEGRGAEVRRLDLVTGREVAFEDPFG